MKKVYKIDDKGRIKLSREILNKFSKINVFTLNFNLSDSSIVLSPHHSIYIL